jgi:hypothetical protein
MADIVAWKNGFHRRKVGIFRIIDVGEVQKIELS